MDYAKKRVEEKSREEATRVSSGIFTFSGMSHADKIRSLEKILKEITGEISDLNPYRDQMIWDTVTLYEMKFLREGRKLQSASENIRKAIETLKYLENRLEQIINKME